MTKTQKQFIFWFILVVIAGTVFFVSTAHADLNILGDKISEQKLGQGQHGELIISERIRDGRKFWLLTEAQVWKTKSTELVGFEDELKPCRSKKYVFGDQTFYCFRGFVGAHSENYVLVNTTTLESVKFKNSANSDQNIYSDVPSAKIEGQSFIIDQRNYDLDPVSNSIRYYYNYAGDQFVFDKKMNIKYDEVNNNFLGDL